LTCGHQIFFKKIKKKYFFKKKKEKEKKEKNGVATATPMEPRGWLKPPPMFGGGFSHPLGPMGVVKPPLVPTGWPKPPPVFSFSFFIF
jgi:hypothetical protein